MNRTIQSVQTMTQDEKLKRLVQRTSEQKRLQTIRFDLTEQERKELDEYIKLHNLPF